MQMQPSYQYAATILRWVDGDTVHVQCQLGFRVSQELIVRLIGIDTPERGRAGYDTAKQRAATLAPAGTQVVLRTYKPDPADKWNRWLGRIFYDDSRDVSTTLLAEGLARPYDGGTKEQGSLSQ